MSEILPMSEEEKTTRLHLAVTPSDALAKEPLAHLQAQLKILEDLENRWLENEAAPVGNVRTSNMLNTIADTLRVPRLQREPMAMYQSVLKLTPTVVFETAWRNVLRTHNFKSMPTPADFVRAAEQEQREVSGMLSTNRSYRVKLEKAISTHLERSNA